MTVESQSLCLLILLTLQLTTGYFIDTYAGLTTGSTGDNGPASSAGLNQCYAGSGSGTSTGNGSPSINAGINNLNSICGDTSNNLYITEGGGNRMRKISAGIISYFAGTGAAGTAGDANGDGGAPLSALLNNPWGCFAGHVGKVYIADENNYKVRVVSGGIISTYAGTGDGTPAVSGDGGQAASANVKQPVGVWGDTNMSIFITQFFAAVVRKVTSGGIISTIAGTVGSTGNTGDGGQALSGTMTYAAQIWGDTMGSLFMADGFNNNVVYGQSARTNVECDCVPECEILQD
eukprot:gene29252-36272_t